LMTIPNSHPRKYVMLQRFMELNWELLIGKYEWDKSDGEVRLSYTFSTENGLGYEAFAACLQWIVLSADRDYPELMGLMWAPEEKPAAAVPTGKPEESAKEKVTAPKEEPPAKEETPAKEEALSKPKAPPTEAPAQEETSESGEESELE